MLGCELTLGLTFKIVHLKFNIHPNGVKAWIPVMSRPRMRPWMS